MARFVPENALEKALVAAFDDPAMHPGFYEALRDAEVWVVHYDEGDGPAPCAVSLEGQAHVAFFSSPTRAKDFAEEDGAVVRLAAREFFENVGDAWLLLNPGTEVGKQFNPGEVQAIRDGSILDFETEEIQEEAQVMLDQPAEYPTELCAALSRLFRTLKGVKRAYLAQMSIPGGSDPPHPLIGIEFARASDWDQVVGAATLVAREVMGDELVEFLPIADSDDDSDVSAYLVNETEPFYTR